MNDIATKLLMKNNPYAASSEVEKDDPFAQVASGLFVPKPSGREVTWLLLRYGTTVKVDESYDVVINQWKSNPDEIIAEFHDWCWPENRLSVDMSEVVSVSIGWEDPEIVKQDLRERELSKKLRDRQIGQMALDASRRK
jgi:hypothetical protein